MSDLQFSLLAVGAVVVAGVYLFNGWQERKYRRAGERIFRDSPKILADPAMDGRVEPSLSDEPGAEETADPSEPADPPSASRSGEPELPQTLGDPRVDYVAEIQGGEPVPEDLLAEVLQEVKELGKPAWCLGYHPQTAAWREVRTGAAAGLTRLRLVLQLADRSGPASTVQLSQLRDLANHCATRMVAAALCPDVDRAAARAAELDAFCAGADVAMAVHVVPKRGGSLPATKVRGMAQALGLSLEPDGVFYATDEGGARIFSLANQDGPPFFSEQLAGMNVTGVTFSMDVPRLADGLAVWDRMLATARQLAQGVEGFVVDDNRVPLNEIGIERIRGQLADLYAAMRARDIHPGGPLALRLFS